MTARFRSSTWRCAWILCGLAFSVGPAMADEVHAPVVGPSLGQLEEGSLTDKALGLLESRPWLVNGSGFEQFIVTRSLEQGERANIFFRVEIDGKRVVGAQISLSVDTATRTVVAIDSNLRDHGSPAFRPGLSAFEAASMAAKSAQLGEWAPSDQAFLQYFLTEDGQSTLAWSQRIERRGDDANVLERIYVDAGTGDLLAIYPEAPHLLTRAQPAVPTLSIFSERCFGQNSLSWTSSAGATYYQLRGSAYSSFTPSYLKYSGSNTYAFVNVGFNNPQYFRVRACNSQGCSAYSNKKLALYVNCCF